MKYNYKIIKTTRAITTMLLSIVFTIFMVGCAKETDGLSGNIEVAGSSTVYPITTAMAEEFIILNHGVNIPIRSTGTGGGFKNFFVNGSTDINNASRPIKDTERARAKENDIDAIEFQVATDAITIIVHKDFPANNITTEMLKTLWIPDSPIKKWSDLNDAWSDENIALYGPSSASGTFDYFTEVINGESGRSRADYQKTEQDNTIVTAVADSKIALGYLGLAYYLENQSKVKALTVNGVAPSIQNARDNSYAPLSRPIFIYVSSKALQRKEVQAFVSFYIMQTASEIISDVGYVPVSEDIKGANMKKLEEMIKKYDTE